MAQLFSPFRLRSIELKNRIVVSPMCQYSSTDGFATDWHLVHLGSRAVGGAALLITEATAVSPEGRISPADLGLWHDGHIAGLRRITDFIHAQGSVAGVQLAHAGRKASTRAPWEQQLGLLTDGNGGWTTLAPSAIPYNEQDPAPEALTKAGIEKVIADFKAAAVRALAAGFKLIELHGAHGYLVHQFLSPLSNQRTDEYGGSFDNRTRFITEIVQAVRSVWPEELPLLVRISASDWAPGGWTPEESVQLAKKLHPLGVDLFDCSSGGLTPAQKITVGPGYQVPFSVQVKTEAGIPTGAVGLITDAQQAEEILTNGQADLVILARQLLRDPYFPIHAAQQLGVEMTWPVQYQRAK